MKIIKTETPTGTIHIPDNPPFRVVGYEEIIYEKLVELNEELKRMNERLDEILREEK